MRKYLDDKGVRTLGQYLRDKFVKKVSGKGLSSNDYTTAEKQKLMGIENNATRNRVFFGECTTSAGTAAKSVTLSAADIEAIVGTNGLIGGDTLVLKFTNTNTNSRPYLSVVLSQSTSIQCSIRYAGNNPTETPLSGDAIAIAGGTAGMQNTYLYAGNNIFVWMGHEYDAGAVDISGKADKVSGAINGNFAALDANGNLTDSGHKHSDYSTTDTKTTAGVKNYTSNNKLYIVGSEKQDENGQDWHSTVTRSNCYIDGDGNIYSKGTIVLTSHQSLAGYATKTWVQNQGYATQTWVGQQGYVTSSSLSNYATKTYCETYVANHSLNIVNEISTVIFGWEPLTDTFLVRDGKYYCELPDIEVVFTSDSLQKCYYFDGSNITEEALSDISDPCYIFGFATENHGSWSGTVVLLAFDPPNGIKQAIEKLLTYEDSGTRIFNPETDKLINFGWLSGSTPAIDGQNGNLRFISYRLATLGAIDCWQLGGTPADSNVQYLDGAGNTEILK